MVRKRGRTTELGECERASTGGPPPQGLSGARRRRSCRLLAGPLARPNACNFPPTNAWHATREGQERRKAG